MFHTIYNAVISIPFVFVQYFTEALSVLTHIHVAVGQFRFSFFMWMLNRMVATVGTSWRYMMVRAIRYSGLKNTSLIVIKTI